MQEKKFYSTFVDFLDFWFGRYGPKSDGKKSIFKKFLKIEELSCESDSGLILKGELSTFKIFGWFSGLWQVVKVWKNTLFPKL